ncbi:MAG: sugar ABC transporter substrate-binding protein [Firmicutes bacterium]|nr:sugar ABC transporter substrate-binding protein [Bacillota bacterium]
MRRLSVALAVLLALALLTASCGGSNQAAPPAKDTGKTWTGTIEWWTFGYTPGGTTPANKMHDEAVAAFEKANPGVKIKTTGIPWQGGVQKLDTALAQGQGPDIFGIASAQLAKYIKQGLLAPIDDYLTPEDKADIYPNILEGVKGPDGKYYAWPLWTPPAGIYINKDILAERNAKMPSEDWTYEDFVALAKQLTFTRANGDKVYGYSGVIDTSTVNTWSFIYADGGKVLSDDFKTYTFNSPQAISGLKKLADLNLVYHVTPPDFGSQKSTDIVTAFKDRKTLAMYTAPSGDATTYTAAGLNFDVVPVPIGKAGKHITVGGLGVMVVTKNKDSGKLATVMKLARYLTGSQIEQDIPGWYLAPAARKSVKIKNNPLMSKFEKMVGYTHLMPNIPPWSEIHAKINPLIQLAVLGKKTPEEALNAPAAEINELLKNNK